MRYTRLGGDGPQVSVAGLGCAAISGSYGHTDRDESVELLRAALDAGITLLDVGDYYGMGAGELLIAEALRGRRREDVIISVKFGGLRDPSGRWLGHDVSPTAAKVAIGYTLTRLGTDYVDVYRPGRIEPGVPVEETIGAIGELVDAGYVRHIGLSEVGAETLRRASAVRPICDLQIEYSLISRGIETAILPSCRELNVAITAYGVLARGLLSGRWTAGRALERGDGRARHPRFQPENLERNLALVEALQEVARARGATVAQLAVAWVASGGEEIVPLLGAKRREQLEELLGGLALELSSDELGEIERAVPPYAVAGSRYPPAILATLDSETR
ncbi:MAG TPA: aldo/keto reductase [Solirubrobacteraceae bacterium]|nr:aldo/keto reductase [Solirubrobacteraceae bacterium]